MVAGAKIILPAVRQRHKSSILLFVLCLLLVNAALPGMSFASQTNSITQFGITWTFDQSYTMGQFANGDYWVVGPVKIIGFNPPSFTTTATYTQTVEGITQTFPAGVTINGSMINPAPVNGQGYVSTDYYYVPGLNVALDVNASNPLTVPVGSSLISTASRTDPGNGNRSQILTAAILTVLTSAPDVNSFRPPYCGTDKTIRYHVSDMDGQLSLLGSLAPVGSPTVLETVQAYFERPWIDHQPGWTSRFMHPYLNMPDYGRELSNQMGIGALQLQLNYTNAQKAKLLTRFVQLGIDNYGIIAAGGTHNWAADGGNQNGRKWPIVFAALMLNDSSMKAVIAKSGDYLYSGSYGPGNPPADYVHFGEDDQTFYVTQADINTHHNLDGQTGNLIAGYTYPYVTDYVQSQLGIPEWGIRHEETLARDDVRWSASYRASSTVTANAGWILAAHIMGMKTLWNHDAIFDYQDRYMQTEVKYRCLNKWVEVMWDIYRANYGKPMPPPPPRSDTTPPSIISVTPTASSVEIQFSEPLDEASAANAGNYGVSDSLKINSVWPELGYYRVILYTEMQTDGKTYTLNVANVKDVAGNPMAQTSITYTYNSGLVGYYLFSDAGDNYILDSSGHNNTGYYINGAHRSDQQEAILGGGNDAVQIPTDDCNAAQGTVALWMNAASMSGTQYIFGHSTGNSSNLIQSYTDNGNLCVGMGNDHLLKTNIQLITPQTWYHIALSWDGTNYALYVNGSLSATGTYAGLTLLNNIADIGNTGSTALRTNGFQGLIDEVHIYNRALTAAEISNLALVFLPIGDKTAAEGNELSFTIRTRPDTTMTLTDSNLPSLPSFTSNTFKWMPDYSNAGTYQVEFTAPHNTSTDVEFEFTDPHDTSIDFEKVTITVTNKSQEDNNSPPIGYWKFDETSGDIASDSSANGDTGYLKNGLTWGKGEINGAVVFSVPNDAVEIKTTNFNLKQGSIAMWVYVQRQTLSRHYFFGHATDATNRIQLYDKYGYLCLGLGDSLDTSVDIQKLQNKKWYHIVLTWNNTTYNVYVNGVLKASGTYSGLTAFADHADIGNNGFGRDMGLNGKIDDVQIYNRVLKDDEIVRLDVGY